MVGVKAVVGSRGGEGQWVEWNSDQTTQNSARVVGVGGGWVGI